MVSLMHVCMCAGSTGDSLGAVIEGISALIAALVIALIASWRLALVLMCVFPFLILGSVFEFKGISQQTGGSNKVLEVRCSSTSMACAYPCP
jgi:hypothetical protein